MIVGDYLILTALQGAFSHLKSNPSLCDEFLLTLKQVDLDLYQQAQQFFAEHDITVDLGWPLESPPDQAGFVYVTLGGESEEEPPIGDTKFEEDNWDASGNPIAVTEYTGSSTNASFNITCYATNQHLCVWLSEAVRWALLAQRDVIDRMGIMEQRISIQDLGIAQQFQPDYVFRRNIALSGSTELTLAHTYTTLLKRVNVLADAPQSPDKPTLDDWEDEDE